MDCWRKASDVGAGVLGNDASVLDQRVAEGRGMNGLRMTPEQVAAHQARVKSARVVRPLPDFEPEDLGPVKKYRNRPTTVDGETFDSKAEADKWLELTLRQRAGEIANVRRQVSYDLVVNGLKVCRYVADFVWVEDGRTIVADVKGYKGGGSYRVFRLKLLLMKAVHGIDIVEL